MMVKVLGRLFVLQRKLMPTEVRNEMMLDTASREKLRLNIYPKVPILNFGGTFQFFFYYQLVVVVGENCQWYPGHDGAQCSIWKSRHLQSQSLPNVASSGTRFVRDVE